MTGVGVVVRDRGPAAWLFLGSPLRAAVVVWLVVFLFIGITTGDLLGSVELRNYRLAHDGRTTTGTVTALHLSDHGGCTYVYKVGNATYNRSETRCGSGRDVGNALNVTYLPDRPTTATALNPSTQFRDGLLLTFVGPTVLAAAAFLGVWIPRRRKGADE